MGKFSPEEIEAIKASLKSVMDAQEEAVRAQVESESRDAELAIASQDAAAAAAISDTKNEVVAVRESEFLELVTSSFQSP